MRSIGCSTFVSRADRDSLDVPLVPLIRESERFTDIKPAPPEADVVRAIQNHLSDVLEARILVSSPQDPAWRPPGSRSETAGGYEIRRKDWRSIRSITAPLRKQDWDARTVYLVSVKLFTTPSPLPDESDHDRGTHGVSPPQEKLPPRIRSTAAVYCFVLSLLNNREHCPFNAIEDVRLTPPSDGEVEPKRTFKGFAFVSLSSRDLVKQLSEDWPWLPEDRSAPLSGGTSTSASADVADARKYGVRVIAKTRWEELRDEYLAYRAQLLNAIHEEDRKYGAGVQSKPGMTDPALLPPVSNGPYSTILQDYPRGCLVFAKNLHTETNKTTLRKLFSSVIGCPQDVLDYVDFNKGMDSVSLGSYYDSRGLMGTFYKCFLRIRNPEEASTLVEHFSAHLLAQSTGLDADGVVPSAPKKPIVMELVEGKKEELYWEKVPEKARRQAIQNVLKLSNNTDTPVGNPSPPSKRRRKY